MYWLSNDPSLPCPDLVVFGRACAHAIAEENTPGEKLPELSSSAGEASVANIDKLRFNKGQAKTAEVWVI